VADVINNLLAAKASDSAEEMTAALRERAARHGWPADIASRLSIEYDGSNLRYSFPEDIEQKVWDLEYGKMPNPTPSSVLRGMEYRMHGFMDEVIDKDLLDTMIMQDEVFNG
jgi:hypothetical protein